jgi:adenylylsulfate reductase subunit B
MSTAIKLDYRRCNGCQRCYDLCPMDVYVIDKEIQMPRVAYEEECAFCGICWMECPKRAIDILYPLSMG